MIRGTRVKVSLPCKYAGYNPKIATVISRTRDDKYVVLLDEVVHVEELKMGVDVIAVSRKKMVRL